MVDGQLYSPSRKAHDRIYLAQVHLSRGTLEEARSEAQKVLEIGDADFNTCLLALSAAGRPPASYGPRATGAPHGGGG